VRIGKYQYDLAWGQDDYSPLLPLSENQLNNFNFSELRVDDSRQLLSCDHPDFQVAVSCSMFSLRTNDQLDQLQRAARKFNKNLVRNWTDLLIEHSSEVIAQGARDMTYAQRRIDEGLLMRDCAVKVSALATRDARRR